MCNCTDHRFGQGRKGPLSGFFCCSGAALLVCIMCTGPILLGYSPRGGGAQAASSQHIDAAEIKQRYREVQKQYHAKRAAGHDLREANELVVQLRREVEKKDWPKVLDLLDRIEKILEQETPPVAAEPSGPSGTQWADPGIRPVWDGNAAFGVSNDFVWDGKQYKLDFAKALGNQITRVHIPWWAVEPRKDTFVFDRADQLIGKHRKAGISLLVTVSSSSPWGTREKGRAGTTASSLPHDFDRYKRFLTKLVERFKRDVQYWQIENEVFYSGFWNGTEQEYVELLKHAYAAIKQADPDAKVVLNGLPDELFVFSNEGDKKARAHFDYVLKEGSDYFDVIDFHQYFRPDIVRLQMKMLQTAMQRFGFRKEIISTEAGGLDVRLLGRHVYDKKNTLLAITRLFEVPEVSQRLTEIPKAENKRQKIKNFTAFLKQNRKTRAILEHYQAEDLVQRASLTLASGASQFYWLCMQDWPEDKSRDWFHVSMCLVDVDGRKKPHFYTYRLLIDKLKGFSGVTQVQLEPTVVMFEFPARAPVYVVWSREAATLDLSDRLSASEVRITHIITQSGKTDRDARVQQLKANAIPVGHTPIFVEPQG